MTMNRLIRRLFFLPVFLTLACGQSSPSAPIDAQATPAPTATPDARAEAPVLAVALEGDVLAISETEYRAKGPEIRCSAFLIENGSAAPILGLAEWRAMPNGAGVFSTGATGVFFIPERSGAIEIEAECEHGGRRLKSPRLILHVAEMR